VSDLQALRAFLGFARSRIEASSFPELEAVLAARGARGPRSQGLSQAHMNVLLGRTAGTYERLERGVTLRPAVLEKVAVILGLTEDEWRALFSYAFSTEPPTPLSPAGGVTLPGEWQMLLDSVTPIAYIIDQDGILVGCNAAFRQVFGDHGVPHHLLRWGLTVSAARDILLDWRTEWAPGLFAQFRAALARNSSETLTELLTDVLADEETAALYKAAGATASTGPQSNRPRPLRHAALGDGWLTMCAATPADAPGTRLTIAPFYEGALPPHRDPIGPWSVA
jgi:transcriptional regulator with XRE-family HTH domain